MNAAKDHKCIHNNAIYSSEEDRIAEILKKSNLKIANERFPIPNPKNTFYAKNGKRIIDLVICVPLIIVLIPVYMIVSLGVFLDVGRPVLYKQTRVGLNGRLFDIYKFRSMNEKKDKDGNLLPPGKRVTRYGRIIRKYSLDELPELLNIIKGDMSIIGPRPLAFFFVERMSERHKKRNAVRPGLECPRVIELDYEYSCKYQRTFENDIWYVENVSFLQDIRLFLLLIKMTFSIKRRGQQAEVKGISYFLGYDENGHAISMRTYKEMMGNRIE